MAHTLKLAWHASKPLSVASLVLVVLAGLSPPAFTVATGRVVDAIPDAIRHGIRSTSGDEMLDALTVLAAVYVLEAVLWSLASVVSGSLSSRFGMALRSSVLDATLSPAGIAHLESPSTADQVDLVASDDQRSYAENAISNLVNVASGKITGLGSFAILLGFAVWAPFLACVPLYLGYRWLTKEIDTFYASLEVTTPDLRRAGYYRELAVRPEAAKELRVFGLGDWIVGRFAEGWTTAMRPIWQARRGHAGPLLQYASGELISSAVLYGMIARAAYLGRISVGDVAMYAAALQGIRGLGHGGDAETAVRRGTRIVARLVRLKGGIRSSASDLSGTVSSADGAIAFEDVYFAYPGTGRAVLNGLSLEIRSGKSLAVVGANGAGKTTLIKLLTRLYDPDDGRIVIGGTDLATIDPDAWRERVAVIFQDFVRYELSARANIGFGSVDLQGEIKALDRAARRAGAHDLVEQLPLGWETILSRGYENGVELSGGQWQRIALARAFMALEAGADVLVLDEPSANLDVRAEAELFERFLEITSGVTTVLISHRFSTVRHADRIVVIEGGRLVEAGAHEDLLAANGRYAQMFKLQAERFSLDG